LLGLAPIALEATEFLVPRTQATVDGVEMKIAPDDVVLLEPGDRGPLRIRNLRGAPGAVIVIRPAGGKVIIRAAPDSAFGIKTQRSSHFRISGEIGGWEITGPQQGVTLDDLSTYFEVDHLEIHHVGFAGIMAKTDPSADPSTHRGAFTLRNASLHHNVIHHTGGEALYVGNSFFDKGRVIGGVTVFPHAIEGLRIYANRTRHTAADGIQVSAATVDCEIFANVIEDYGEKPFDAYQNSGLMIGAGTSGQIHHNFILRGSGNGMTLLGAGDLRVESNLIISAGEHGIFCDERPPATNTRGSHFLRNTIVQPKGDAIRLYYRPSSEAPHILAENRLLAPGSGIFIGRRDKRVLVRSMGNLTASSLAEEVAPLAKLVAPETLPERAPRPFASESAPTETANR